jgi:hypothetical protein
MQSPDADETQLTHSQSQGLCPELSNSATQRLNGGNSLPRSAKKNTNEPCSHFQWHTLQSQATEPFLSTKNYNCIVGDF